MIKFGKKLKYSLFIAIFISMLLFGCKKEMSQSEMKLEKTNIENILLHLNSKKYDSLVRGEYEKLILPYYNKKDTAYYQIAKDFEKNSEKSRDSLGLINSQINLGQYFYNNFVVDSSYYYYTKAEKYSSLLKEKPYLGAILICKAGLLIKQKNYSEAQNLAIKALKIARENNYNDYVMSSFLLIGNSLEGLGKNNEAIDYYLKALAISETILNSKEKEFLVSAVYTNLAGAYQKLNNQKKVIEYVNKGLAIEISKIDNINFYCYLKNTLAKSIYKIQKQQALSIYSETLKIGDSLKYAPIQVASQLQLGEYYLFYKDTLKANTYLKRSKELAHQNKLFDDELIILKLLSKSNPSKSNYYSERYIHLNDSLLAVERATRDKFARIEFETDEISTQKDLIELKNKKLNTRLLLASGIALLSILSLFLWFKNKSNKAKITELKLLQEKQELQNNELLFIQEQQRKDEKMYQLLLHQQDKIEEGKQTEKIRISRELHDGIMGKLSGIRLNLYILKKKTDPETIARCLEYIKEIQVIENDLRKLSHDLNKDTISTANGIENEINNLFNEINNHQNIEFDLQIEHGLIWENINYIAKLNLYRIIQEALHNIDKYAKAKKVVIAIAQKEQSLLIQIKDDGIGFDLNLKKEGIGLKNMRERTEESGGTFSIETAPKKGTKINLLLPF